MYLCTFILMLFVLTFWFDFVSNERSVLLLFNISSSSISSSMVCMWTYVDSWQSHYCICKSSLNCCCNVGSRQLYSKISVGCSIIIFLHKNWIDWITISELLEIWTWIIFSVKKNTWKNHMGTLKRFQGKFQKCWRCAVQFNFCLYNPWLYKQYMVYKKK